MWCQAVTKLLIAIKGGLSCLSDSLRGSKSEESLHPGEGVWHTGIRPLELSTQVYSVDAMANAFKSLQHMVLASQEGVHEGPFSIANNSFVGPIIIEECDATMRLLGVLHQGESMTVPWLFAISLVFTVAGPVPLVGVHNAQPARCAANFGIGKFRHYIVLGNRNNMINPGSTSLARLVANNIRMHIEPGVMLSPLVDNDVESSNKLLVGGLVVQSVTVEGKGDRGYGGGLGSHCNELSGSWDLGLELVGGQHNRRGRVKWRWRWRWRWRWAATYLVGRWKEGFGSAKVGVVVLYWK